ncbi:MAG: M1 family aminopeptidase [candidate division Zixibacteria bacterium]
MKIGLLTIVALLLSSLVSAQDISRDDFRNAEWKMKSLYFEKLSERQTGNIALNQADYDVIYWELDIDVTDIGGQTVSGVVTMTSESTIDGLSLAEYDLHSSMTVDQVTMNGSPVSYTHAGNTLAITLDQAYNTNDEFTTVVSYHGHPPGSGFGSFTWDTHSGQPIISTLSEPEGAREWWPCKDVPHDKANSADIIITVPDNLVATSNGMLISDINNGDGTRTFHWEVSYPITTYLISLAISNYQSFTDWYIPDVGDPIPITNYVYPEDYSDAVEDFNITAQVMGVFADMFGEYPFVNEKYGHSEFPWGGAMEHQCNTSYGAALIRGDHAYDWILVHELAHQWFGDMISCDTWPDIWMNEGFASYLEALYEENQYGFGAYRNYLLYMNGVSDPSGPIYNPSPLFGSNTVYNKGSWVLHILRGVMGDQAFFDGMYGYANHPDHQYGTITTIEFRDIMAEYYGAPLDWFFDEWVWGMNRPEYEYSWIDEDIGGGQYELFLHIDQVQGSPAPEIFTMPIKIYPTISGNETEMTVWNDNRAADYRIVVDGNVTQLQLDKYDWILRSVNHVGYTMNIVTVELPEVFLNLDYTAQIEARGGQPPYHFEVIAGALPSGLVLDENTGFITGLPDVEGEYSFTIRCNDSSGPVLFDLQDYSMTVICNYVTGDFNGSGDLNVADIISSFSKLKAGVPEPALLCECPPGTGDEWAVAMDVNNSCEFNVADVIAAFSKLSSGFPELVSCEECPPQ